MLFDFTSDAKSLAYKLLTATIVPRPIAWLVSQNGDGQLNAAPFSFFNLFGSAPPVVALGISKRDGQIKDSLANIRATGTFQICLVPASLAQHMNQTAIDAPAGVDELALAGLSTTKGIKIPVPRISESPVSLECKLQQEVQTGPMQSLAIAEVLALHVEDEFILDAKRGHIATAQLDLIGRAQGTAYAKMRDYFDLDRPVWPETDLKS